jgi:hypothetical protein
MPDPHEGIEHDDVGPTTMQLDAKYGEIGGKRGGMRTLFGAAHDRLVRNEPVVSATAQVLASRGAHRLMLVVRMRNANRAPVQLRLAALGQMENVFMTVGHKSVRLQRFEVAGGNDLHRPS